MKSWRWKPWTSENQCNEKDFVDSVCKDRVGIDAEALGAELRKLAAGPMTATSSDPSESPEVDTAKIVRPERIIQPEVSAVAVRS